MLLQSYSPCWRLQCMSEGGVQVLWKQEKLQNYLNLFVLPPLLFTIYLQSALIKGEASERSPGWNCVFSLVSGVVCRGGSTDLWWCYSSICKGQKSPGAEAASRSGSHYNPSKHSWTLLHHMKVFSSAPSSKCHLLLQKQQGKFSQLWLYYFSLILVEFSQRYDYSEGWCSSGSWLYGGGETCRGHTFISISSWGGELSVLSFTSAMDWYCRQGVRWAWKVALANFLWRKDKLTWCRCLSLVRISANCL